MMGDIKKLKLNPLILDDKIVKDGLSAVSLLTDKEPYYLVGGVAVQSYLPTNCRRPTSDIDICTTQPLNFQRFLEVVKPICEYLKDNGYSVSTKKGSRAFSLEVGDKDNNGLLIELPKRNEKSLNKHISRLERELKNSKRKYIETTELQYIACSSEDIIIPKLVRDIHALMRNPLLVRYMGKDEKISSPLDITWKLDQIEGLRNRSMGNKSDASYFDELKFVSDIYDIQLLSEIVGINLDYFKKGGSEWTTLTEKSEERDLFFNNILPISKDFKF